MTQMRRSALSMTARDHRAIGSTPLPVQVRNPDRTLAEMMSDREILDRLRRDVPLVREVRANAAKGEQELRTYTQARDTLIADIQYLREIGRVPEEFADIDLSEFDL